MFEQQTESDDDCEVYFLKPVNEYNIVDKIKEANKELFADSDDESKANNNIEVTESITNVSTTTTMITTTTTTIRKVTFAPNLEDYEPESPTHDNDNENDNEIDSIDLKKKIKSGIEKFPTIDEQEEQINSPQQSIDEEMQKTNIEENKNEIDEIKEINDETKNIYFDEHQNEIDEICEEIIIMEMDEGNITTTTSSSTTKTTTMMSTVTPLLKEDSLNTQQQQRRLMMKQTTTFDYDEQDNKSLTNLLTASDCEEEIGLNTLRDTDDSDANDASIFLGIDDFDDDNDDDGCVNGVNNDDYDDDDDDKLSLIVASYLPDDFERTISMTPSSPMTSTLPSTATNSTFNNTKTNSKSNYSYFRRNSGKSKNNLLSTSASASSTSNSLSFGKRFQLRRKAHSTNSIGTICDDPEKTELTDLKLNYKTCCEYRNSIQGKLPKYTGYLSEYGLSREQLQQREQQLQKKQRFVLEHTLRANEEEIRKMQDNERAFTTWLKNKMRFPINKTRNMFDVKLKLNGKVKTKATSTTSTTTTSSSPAIKPMSATNSRTKRGPFGCTPKFKTN